MLDLKVFLNLSSHIFPQRDIKRGIRDVDEDNPFELFIAYTDIRYTYYSETHKVLGNTFGMCVLQVGAKLQFVLLSVVLCSWERGQHF